LHIVTDSKYVLKGLTVYAREWEENGWFGVKNASAVRDVLARLRARSAPTTFRWVKGHSGDPGNEGADMLAKDAVRLRRSIAIPDAPLKFVASGAILMRVSQKLAYGMISRTRKPDCRHTTRKNLDKAIEAVYELSDLRLTDAAIWAGIWKLDVDRPVRAFWWKMMHGAQRLGAYWNNISNCADRAYCKYCGALETMSHILMECNIPGRVALWTEAIDLLDKRGILVDQVSFGHILGLGVLVLPKNGSQASPADVRLSRIVLAELMYLSWVLRCEWTIGREGDMSRLLSVAEVLNRWYWRVNRRLRLDVSLVRRAKMGLMPSKDVVLATWRGLISCNGDEPEDWMSLSEVLVG
ncbi:RnaseH-domain-containing protein, partial [Polyporus arcularius HHB13444]